MPVSQSFCATLAAQQAHLAASCQIRGMQSLTTAATVNSMASVDSIPNYSQTQAVTDC